MSAGRPAGNPDSNLVRSVRAGDEEAFRELFRRYGPVAHGLAFRLLRHEFMAEEVVQEVFLSLWRNPDGFREDRGSVRAWLLSTVHHKAVDTVRREEAERRRTRQQASWDVELEGDVGEAVVEEAAAQDARAAVRAVLREIPPEQRQVLELMYFGGNTQAQIARDLEIPLGTVKARTLLGMRRLRGLLGEDRR